MTFDESYDDEIKVTIIATGFQETEKTVASYNSNASQHKVGKAEDFITRGAKTLKKEEVIEEMAEEEDIDTPAFMRKKIS